MAVQLSTENAELVILRRVYEAFRLPNDTLIAELADGNWFADVQESLTQLRIEPPVGWGSLAAGFLQPRKVIFDLLTGEYVRLFVNSYGETPAPPYASVYLSVEDGPLVALQVSNWYLRAGMALPPDYPEPPDSLSIELEFLIYLHQSITEAGRAQTTKQLRMIMKEFCANHMTKWIPRFADRVKQAGAMPFYSVTVDLLAKVVAHNA